LRLSIISATLVSAFAFLVIEAVPGHLVRIFNSDSIELYNIAVHGVRLVILAYPVVGFQVVASNFFQAVGKAKIAMFSTLFRQVIGLIPLIFWLPEYLGITGIWLAYPLADLMAAVAVVFLLIREWKRLPWLVAKPSSGSSVVDMYPR